MLRTGFLNYRRSYMTTLRARWEKPDYTGVTAEVPLGHIPHPKNLLTTAFTLLSLFQNPPGLWTVYSPVTERSKLMNLQVFLEDRFSRQWAHLSVLLSN